MNVVRAISSEGFGRIRYNTLVRRLLEEPAFRSYLEGEPVALPTFYEEQVRKDLGVLWAWLPQGALIHDPDAYLRSVENGDGHDVSVQAVAAGMPAHFVAPAPVYASK